MGDGVGANVDRSIQVTSVGYRRRHLDNVRARRRPASSSQGPTEFSSQLVRA
ncbi:hypothetical protein HLY00_4344 [Mycolicibacterium hippocampi]|uniref:Uncharacterized protein n=1 Tax=Mycolicibacterium hippocampi TaxID=659824 RepID=A0A850PY98_9MYCO|nr:hypothetical protein [Mycolicibacterium hippocampi]